MFTRILISLSFLLAVNSIKAQETTSLFRAPINESKHLPLKLDPIVVTTQKREQPVQEVPIAMTIVNEKDLEKARASSLAYLQQLVPGFSLENQSGSDALTIRGVGGGGRNIGFDPRVGVYLDGIYLGQVQALRQPLFDIERVEVLRGPQGHLFGRNTVAGAVNIVTNTPSNELEGYLRSVVGSNGTREAYATISGPITELVAGKISIATEMRDGFTTNNYGGQKLDDLTRSSVRGRLVFHPNNQLDISLAVDKSNIKQKLTMGEAVSDLFGMPLASGKLLVRKVNINTSPSDITNLWGSNLTANYKMDGDQTLTAIVGYRNTQQTSRQDSDHTSKDLLWTFSADEFEQFSEELRIASSDTGQNRYVFGLFHIKEVASTDRTASIGGDAATTLVRHPLYPFSVPFPAVTGTAVGATVSNNGKIETHSYALFGALDHEITTALTLNFGGRYTYETKDVVYNLDGSASGYLDIGNLNDYRDSRSEKHFLPTIGATYALNPQQNVYVKYASGFKSGGWNTDFLSSNGVKKPAFNTESVDSYEVGTKGQVKSGHFRYALAAYLSEYKDYQVLQLVDLGGGASSIELRNAARVESHGIEGNLALSATERLDIGIGFNLGKAYFTQFGQCSASVNCTGHRLFFSPEFTSLVTMSYSMPMPSIKGKFGLYGEYSYHGSSYSDSVNDPTTQKLASREMVNMRWNYVAYNSHWDGSLWVRNLFNSDAVVSREKRFLGNLSLQRENPRAVGLEAKYNFY